MEAFDAAENPLLSLQLRKACGDLVSMVEKALVQCDELWFITLTTNERLNPITLSAEVSRAFLRGNSQLFGTHFKRRGVRLVTFMVREKTVKDGWHMHALVGALKGTLTLKAFPCRKSVPEAILDTWIELGPLGRRQAVGQDAREIYDFEGVARYVLKGVRRVSDLDNIDYLNTHFPSDH